MKDILVTFSDKENKEINLKIASFVQEMQNKGKGPSIAYYENHRKAVKAAQDIFLGKKAEFVVQRGLNLDIDVDVEIRYRTRKGWQPDFVFGDINYHVKACNVKTLEYCGDYSWTFQASNADIGGGKDDLLSSDGNDLVVLVYMEDALSPVGVIKSVSKWSDIKQCLKDPIKKSLRGLKKCLYYKDL